jgi:hypothetical protein
MKAMARKTETRRPDRLGKLLSSLGEQEHKVASFDDVTVGKRVGEFNARSETTSLHTKRPPYNRVDHKR